jgi:hypothetical protein
MPVRYAASSLAMNTATLADVADPAERGVRHLGVAVPRLLSVMRPRSVRLDCRVDHVDGDSVLAPFACRGLAAAAARFLVGVVCRGVLAAHHAATRAEVDDPTPASSHVGKDGLHGAKTGFHPRLECPVPLVFGKRLDGVVSIGRARHIAGPEGLGAVDQDVDVSEVVDGGFDQSDDLVVVADVARASERDAA